MLALALRALSAGVVGIAITIPVAIGLAALEGRDPADWRAFLRFRLPRKLKR